MCCCFASIDHEQAWQNEPLSHDVRAHHGKQNFSPTMSALDPSGAAPRLCPCWRLISPPSCCLWAHVHALDPNKHLTQYVHTAWRTQDGSLPSGMFSITQTSDDFLYLLSLPGDRFVPSRVPLGLSGKVFADTAGGLWVVADELVHLNHGIVVSHFKLKGIHGFQSVSSDADGTLWVSLRRGLIHKLCYRNQTHARCGSHTAHLC